MHTCNEKVPAQKQELGRWNPYMLEYVNFIYRGDNDEDHVYRTNSKSKHDENQSK